MKKQFINVLLCGAMVFSTGAFTSCDYDDDELKSRMTVIEVAVADLKAQLANALTTGASVIGWNPETGELKLSDGKTIIVKGGSGDISVADGTLTIVVDGTSYTFPMGAPVNSLIYSPEYFDGIVKTDEKGMATVKFLATPTPNAAKLAKAEFAIAASHEIKTRGGEDLFEVKSAELEDGLVKVNIGAADVEAGKTFAVALLMKLDGATISSDYFKVEINSDYTPGGEEIGGFTIKSAYSPANLEEGFSEMTINGLDLLNLTNFKDLFDELPANPEFKIASASRQPEGHAQEKHGILNSSLKKDGSWAFSERPGTSFNNNGDRPGFLFNILSEGVTKAKIYVVINDELANVDFVGIFKTETEAEWGGREKYLELGAQEIDIPVQVFTRRLESEGEVIIHRGDDGKAIFDNWSNYAVGLKDETDIIYNDGQRLVLGNVGKAYAAGSKGIYWACRGFAIYVPEALGTGGSNGEKYVDENGKEWSRAEGYGYDYWGSQVVDMNNQFMMNEGREWGFDLTQDGKLKTPASYTGYGIRFGFGVGYEYAYGVKKLHQNDCLGLIFFNRRLAPAGADMPAPKP